MWGRGSEQEGSKARVEELKEGGGGGESFPNVLSHVEYV